MTDVIAMFGPLLAFMLIPPWIPIIAVSVGALADAIRPRGDSELVKRVRAATSQGTSRSYSRPLAG